VGLGHDLYAATVVVTATPPPGAVDSLGKPLPPQSASVTVFILVLAGNAPTPAPAAAPAAAPVVLPQPDTFVNVIQDLLGLPTPTALVVSERTRGSSFAVP